ncbi:unnamed protein product [Triticum turgidum subsp. durum]|uniref:Uncharacterized protein n=1 Tax=Triticum turgidum subsp. durum TaxID=4567 RepID=A0A9R1PPB2_TRITD|nr:unnamed protein product [Triticum turgidum subsp. durum]
MPGRGGEEGAAVRLARIRKRRALSSSDSSNAARRLRSRRPAVLLIRRRREGGAAMSDSSSRSRHCRRHVADGASARRLVTAFWQSDKDRLFGEEHHALVMDKDAAARRSLVPKSNASTEASKSSRSRTKIKMFEEAGGRKGSCHNGHGQWPSADVMSNCSAMEIGTHPQDDEEKAIQLKDLYNSLIASKELAKVLAHIWGEVNPSTVSLVSALRSELDLARAHVRRLIKEQKSERGEIDGLKKELVEEMEAWKAKQKEKAATALQYIVTELDKEKKSRRRAERAKEKLGAALADAESSLRAANKELERERKSRGRVEKMCGELVRGIGEDRAEVEALKREAEDAQRELEKEREMLHLADEWREQRVQMKLLEARLQFEEKNSALNQLHDELQAYLLDAKKGQEPATTDQMRSTHASENGGAASGPVPAPDNAGDGGFSEDCDSEGSDMHSIELNVDGNGNLHTWSYTPSSRRDRRVGAPTRMDDAGSRCGVDRKTFRETDDALEGDWAEGCSNGMLNFDHDEERYQAIKDLREQMLAGSGLLMSQGRETAQSHYCIL